VGASAQRLLRSRLSISRVSSKTFCHWALKAGLYTEIDASKKVLFPLHLPARRSSRRGDGLLPSLARTRSPASWSSRQHGIVGMRRVWEICGWMTRHSEKADAERPEGARDRETRLRPARRVPTELCSRSPELSKLLVSCQNDDGGAFKRTPACVASGWQSALASFPTRWPARCSVAPMRRASVIRHNESAQTWKAHQFVQ